MTRIDRAARTIAVAIASALLVACGSDEAAAPVEQLPPGTPPAPTSVVGTWTSRQIDGKAMPARIAGGTEEDGLTWELRALHDTLIVQADGRWVQRARTMQTQSDGFNIPGVFGDRGTWTRNGSTIHFTSDWIQNVAFDATLQADGTLVVMHDFTLDDNIPALRRDMQR